MQNFESFRAKNWDFQIFRDILDIEKDCMICKIIEENTIHQADLDLSETSIEVLPQLSWSFISEFKLAGTTTTTK